MEHYILIFLGALICPVFTVGCVLYAYGHWFLAAILIAISILSYTEKENNKEL